MGKSDDDTSDELMEQMKHEVEVREKVLDCPSDTPKGIVFKPLSTWMMTELMERVEACKSEEEGNDLIDKFFKDIYEGKLTPYQ